MTSDRRQRANRANAKSSTGPKTAAGKARAADQRRLVGANDDPRIRAAEEMPAVLFLRSASCDRFRCFDVQSASTGLWKEKRGEAEPEDLSENLIVQLGIATEPLNRTW